MIVRNPFKNDQHFVPVALVSENYTLIQHTAVYKIILEALNKIEISPDNVTGEIFITKYGERMALRVYLSSKFGFSPGDGNEMELLLECFNSVDATTKFSALLIWFRTICNSGLVVGVSRMDIRRRHIGNPRVDDLAY